MQFDFNVGAYQSQHIDVAGTFVKYKSGTGTIRVRLNGGGYIDLLPGQGVNNVSFVSVDVQDRTGAQNVGTILAGMYDFRDDRITGTVDVVDGGKTRTLQGIAFYAYVNGGAQSGMYAHNQLWNPAGSGKNLIVEKVLLSNGGTATLQSLRAGTVMMPSLAPEAPKNKRIGGTTSVAQCRFDLNAAQAGALMFNSYVSSFMLAPLVQNEPIVIPPGAGLMTVGGQTGYDAPATFEYYEDPV